MSKLLLIAGVSRSGKSSFARTLVSSFESTIHLEQDRFVKAEKDIPTIKERTNWEVPESIDWEKWNHAITKALSNSQLVIAEGIFCFHEPNWVIKADLTLLLVSTEKEFLERRIQETRWGPEPDWYLQYVWKAHLQYHNPHRIEPDFTFQHWTQNEIEQVIAKLKD